MNFIDKEHIALFEACQNRSQIACSLKYRSGCRLDLNTHLFGDNIGEGRFTQTRRAKYQGMIQRFTTSFGRPDENLHLLPHMRLTNVVIQHTGPDSAILLFFTKLRRRCDKAISFYHLPPMVLRRAIRIISSGVLH